MAIGIVTVGDTRRKIIVAVVDENGNPVTLSATLSAHQLQGRSPDLSAKVINLNASVVDTAQGLLTFNTVGTLVTQAELTTAVKDRATFRLKCKYTDNAALLGFTEAFEYIWDEDPLQAA